ncbi:MAG: hypothetical protein WBK51_13545 [Polaromonas sp.]
MHKPTLVRRPMDKSAGSAMAQHVQRGLSVAKRAMQALQTGSDGQARQTAHWLGSRRARLGKGFCSKRLNTRSIYSGSNHDDRTSPYS